MKLTNLQIVQMIESLQNLMATKIDLLTSYNMACLVKKFEKPYKAVVETQQKAQEQLREKRAVFIKEIGGKKEEKDFTEEEKEKLNIKMRETIDNINIELDKILKEEKEFDIKKIVIDSEKNKDVKIEPQVLIKLDEIIEIK